MTADLVTSLETPLPATLPAGSATALFLFGTCFHREAGVVALEVTVDGRRFPTLAAGMPKRAAEDPLSGFWAIVPVRPDAAGEAVAVGLVARLDDGLTASATLGHIAVVVAPEPAPVSRPAAPGLVAICMATFEPDLALFRTQIESLRGQEDDHWVCVISDDASEPDAFAALCEVVGDDPRFVVNRSERRLGFYRNFERALTLAPGEAELIALCDQDDRWYPEKLTVLRAALGRAQLVFSDQRLVDADGAVLRETMWARRAGNHTDLVSMLVANTVTGAAALFRRDVARLALPFPDTPGLPFHDHWIGLVALAAGDVGYVDRPLYDYVQHRGAFFGAVTHGEGGGRRLRPPDGRAAYFRGYLPRVLLATVLLERCAPRISARKARALRRFGAAARSPVAFSWLALRPLRVLVGQTETLGSESELLVGIVWRWAIGVAAACGLHPRRGMPDAALPDVLAFQQRRLRRWRARL